MLPGNCENPPLIAKLADSENDTILSAPGKALVLLRPTEQISDTPINLTQKRPPFMSVLGLLPPLELEDVKAAYKAKALEHHPDRGGNPSQFIRVKDAYEQALEFVAFQGSR